MRVQFQIFLFSTERDHMSTAGNQNFSTEAENSTELTDTNDENELLNPDNLSPELRWFYERGKNKCA